MKHILSFAVAWHRVLSKFLTKLLQRSIQALDRSITHRVATTTNPVFPRAAFLRSSLGGILRPEDFAALVGLGASSKRSLFRIWG